MMRIYQGIDLVDIPKFEAVASRNAAFLFEVFTDRERRYCLSMHEPFRHFAGRFAAKEACLKALGVGLTGLNNVLGDIEVSTTPSGKPELAVHGWADRISRRRGIRCLTLSISHTTQQAVAIVILLGKKETGATSS